MRVKINFSLAGSVLAIAACASSQTVSAQEGSQTDSDATTQAPEDRPSAQVTEGQTEAGIVVTANRREELLNDVATAVSAFTAEDRTIRGILSTQDVAKFTPGVSISDNPNRVNIRGVGRVTNALGSDPGVANYVDGFYTSESDVIGSSEFLTERVEVLRGPQGTLYGRNSIGGAANIISKRPTDEFQVEGRAFINDYIVTAAPLQSVGRSAMRCASRSRLSEPSRRAATSRTSAAPTSTPTKSTLSKVSSSSTSRPISRRGPAFSTRGMTSSRRFPPSFRRLRMFPISGAWWQTPSSA